MLRGQLQRPGEASTLETAFGFVSTLFIHAFVIVSFVFYSLGRYGLTGYFHYLWGISRLGLPSSSHGKETRERNEGGGY